MSIEAWTKSVREWFYPTPPQATPPAPKVPLEVFKEKLSWLSALDDYSALSPLDDCVNECIASVMEVLKPAHFDLSEASQKEILVFIEQFEAEAVVLADEDEKREVILGFKTGLATEIEDKWTESMAQSFYPIPKISDENERARAAQTWTNNFFREMQFLNPSELFASNTSVSGRFVNTMANKTMLAFHVHAYDEIQNRMSTMVRLYEKDLAKFNEKIQEVEVKVEDEPGTVIVDKQFEPLLKDAASALSGYWPEVEEGKDQLKKCIWNGFTLHDFKLSIVDHQASLGLFKSVFKKDPQ
jgi:hypothetical protein